MKGASRQPWTVVQPRKTGRYLGTQSRRVNHSETQRRCPRHSLAAGTGEDGILGAPRVPLPGHLGWIHVPQGKYTHVRVWQAETNSLSTRDPFHPRDGGHGSLAPARIYARAGPATSQSHQRIRPDPAMQFSTSELRGMFYGYHHARLGIESISSRYAIRGSAVTIWIGWSTETALFVSYPVPRSDMDLSALDPRPCSRRRNRPSPSTAHMSGSFSLPS